MRNLVFVMAGMAMSLAVLAAADAQQLRQHVNWPAGGFLQADQDVLASPKPKDLNVNADEGFCWLSGVTVTKASATATATPDA